MSEQNPLVKISDSLDSFVEDFLYGKHTDIFERHARKRAYHEKYGVSPDVGVWLPVLYAYVGIRDALKNAKLSTTEKAVACVSAVGIELVLDGVRVGCAYGLYVLGSYVLSTL